MADTTNTSTPLSGKRIVVTRAAAQAGGLCEALAAAGAVPVCFPTIACAAMPDRRPLRAVLQRLPQYNWVVFTSTNGVAFFWEALAGRPLPAGLRVAAVGTQTAAALAAQGRAPDLVPDIFDAEHLAACFGDVKGQSFLLPQAAQARPTLAERLTAQGGAVDVVAVYETVGARPDAAAWAALDQPVDALTFTSPSTADHFAALLGVRAGEIAAQAAVVCIGPITADAARAQGWTVARVAAPHTVDGLMTALEEALSPVKIEV